MSSFVYTPKGFVNLSSIQRIKHSHDGKTEIVVDGEVMDNDNRSMDNALISIASAGGEWLYLVLCEAGDGSSEIFKESVIAWGLTAFGSVVPVIPSDLGNLRNFNEDYALQKVGEESVSSRDQTYENEQAWLEDILGKKKQLRTV